MNGRNRLTVLATVLVLGLWIQGCLWVNHDADRSAASEYHLNPPELSNSLVARGEPGVPVLCYHYFRSDFQPRYLLKVVGAVLFGLSTVDNREFWTTPRAQLKMHLDWFRETGTRVMTLDEVADLIERGDPLPERAVVLTIDDADVTVYEVAWPLLSEYGVKAHLFVPTGKVGHGWSGLQLCSWEQLREMSDSGTILVESHSRDLHYKVATTAGMEPVIWHPNRIPTLPSIHRDGVARKWEKAEPEVAGDAALLLIGGAFGPVSRDLVRSRLDIIEGVGRAPRWLSWPYGFANGALDSVARSVGFRGSVSLKPVAFSLSDTTLAAGRVTLTAKTTMREIRDIWEPVIQ